VKLDYWPGLVIRRVSTGYGIIGLARRSFKGHQAARGGGPARPYEDRDW